MSTGIDYIDEVWNPITGCSGKGCKAHCWARDMVKRFSQIHGYKWVCEDQYSPAYPIPFNEVQFHPDRLEKPLHWRKPRRIGVCFMGELFDEQVKRSQLNMIFNIITSTWEKGLEHQFFLLTKRPKKMRRYIEEHIYCETAICANETTNIYLGVSVCDQEDADRRIPELLKIPGKKWISIEPMISSIDISSYIGYYPIKNKGGYHEANDKRKNDLSTCGVGGIRNRRPRENLEGKEKDRKENRRNAFKTMQKGKSGTEMGRLSSGEGDDQLEKVSLSGSSSCISPLPRTDTEGSAIEPQEREENGQSTGEFRTNDLFGEHKACLQNRVERRERRKESSLQADQRADQANQENICSRRSKSTGIGESIRDRFPNSIANSKGKESEATSWTDRRLCLSETAQQNGSQQQGSILFCVIGSESGPKRRPCEIQWMVNVVKQCENAGVPIYVKQVDTGSVVSHDPNEWPDELRTRELIDIRRIDNNEIHPTEKSE